MIAGNYYLIGFPEFIPDPAGTVERIVGEYFVDVPHDDTIGFIHHRLVIRTSARNLQKLALARETDMAIFSIKESQFLTVGQGAIFFSASRALSLADR